MSFIYTLGILAYTGIARVLGFFGYKKAQLMLEGRKNTWPQLKQFRDAHPDDALVWIHCASLGEFEQGRPVLEAIKKEYPQHKILLSFFSPSGYEACKNYALADIVCYLPADTAKNAREFVSIIQPKIALFVKYEFWYYFLRELHQNQIPSISFSAIFQPDFSFFQFWGGFSRQALRFLQYIFVQQQKSKELLEGIDITNVSVAPDTRFDRVYQICQLPKDIPIAEKFASDTPTLIIGSAWESDLEQIAPVLKQWKKPLKLIIAPHEIGEVHLTAIEKLFGKLPLVRYSEANTENIEQARVLLIDNIGMLSSLYQYGQWAYIGGAFGKGLHNTLEAATFGLPIIFGPRYDKFQEAIDLVDKQGAFSINNGEDFAKIFAKLYPQEEFYTVASKTTKQYVQDNLGGTGAIMDYIQPYL